MSWRPLPTWLAALGLWVVALSPAIAYTYWTANVPQAAQYARLAWRLRHAAHR